MLESRLETRRDGFSARSSHEPWLSIITKLPSCFLISSARKQSDTAYGFSKLVRKKAYIHKRVNSSKFKGNSRQIIRISLDINFIRAFPGAWYTRAQRTVTRQQNFPRDSPCLSSWLLRRLCPPLAASLRGSDLFLNACK